MKASFCHTEFVTFFLCGDVMTGRGIDQILWHPSDPILYEPYMKDARGYLQIAEDANGPIPRGVAPAYIWGEALPELERRAPDLRIVNLETAITRSDNYWKTKEIHYRMHPKNIEALTVARIDLCSLANNHVLDWGYAGLRETLETLRKAKIWGSGGRDESEGGRIPCHRGGSGKGQGCDVRPWNLKQRHPNQLGCRREKAWGPSGSTSFGRGDPKNPKKSEKGEAERRLTVYHFWPSFSGTVSNHEKGRSVGGRICCLRELRERVWVG